MIDCCHPSPYIIHSIPLFSVPSGVIDIPMIEAEVQGKYRVSSGAGLSPIDPSWASMHRDTWHLYIAIHIDMYRDATSVMSTLVSRYYSAQELCQCMCRYYQFPK